MPRKGSRERVEDGISRDLTGYSIRVKVTHGGMPYSRERRFPRTVDLPYLRAQRAQLEADLRSELQERDPVDVAATRGTFAGDVRTYLARMRTKLDARTYRSRASELERWVEVFGHRPRHTLRAADVERAFVQWQTPPKDARRERVDKKGRRIKPRPWTAPGPKTIQNRIRTLKHLHRTLDGTRARTPADNVIVRTPPRTRPRGVSIATIRTVIARLIKQERNGRLRDAKTRARFLVMVTTGQRPGQIARTTAADVMLSQHMWWVPAAKGGEPVPLPLNADMLVAWQLFIAAKAWGTWDSRSFARTLRTSGWPADVRPYQTRHSVGIALSEAGVELGDIQPFLGHSQLQTTRSFYVPGLLSRLKAASNRLDKRVDLSPRWARFAGTQAAKPVSRSRCTG
jgi:integrase